MCLHCAESREILRTSDPFQATSDQPEQARVHSVSKVCVDRQRLHCSLWEAARGSFFSLHPFLDSEASIARPGTSKCGEHQALGLQGVQRISTQLLQRRIRTFDIMRADSSALPSQADNAWEALRAQHVEH